MNERFVWCWGTMYTSLWHCDTELKDRLHLGGVFLHGDLSAAEGRYDPVCGDICLKGSM